MKAVTHTIIRRIQMFNLLFLYKRTTATGMHAHVYVYFFVHKFSLAPSLGEDVHLWYGRQVFSVSLK